MLPRCHSIAFTLRKSPSAIWRLVRPPAASSATRRSLGVSPSAGAGAGAGGGAPAGGGGGGGGGGAAGEPEFGAAALGDRLAAGRLGQGERLAQSGPRLP